MKAMKIENQNDAIDVAFRIVGLAQAISTLLNPVSGSPKSIDTQFAARMATEALENYADVILPAVDLPNPALVFIEPRS
jgi:hypothetical protein